jgi:hypothetical protein
MTREPLRGPGARMTIEIGQDTLSNRTFFERLPAIEDDLPAASVVDAVERAYQLAGRATAARILAELVTSAIDPAVGAVPVVVDVNRSHAEVVATRTTPLAALREATRRLAADRWDVVLLVPISRLGEAHEECNDSSVSRLQPYWKSDMIVFGRPETP